MKKKYFIIYSFVLFSNFFYKHDGGVLFSQTNKSNESIDSVKIDITNLGNAINTSFGEYAPIISADGTMMIFTSKRPIGDKNSKRKERMENIYVSYFNDTTHKWMDAKILGETVNQPKRNNSAIALSNDGQRLFLYRGTPDGNIYESFLKGIEWSEPVKLPEPINSEYQESSASISPDGRTIYFISDRKHGEGGSDIWLCHQDNKGNWGEAKNLGNVINTSKDEEGVFIHPDGKTLYFSSKGHDSKGGFDIFKSVFENNKWSTPVNLGEPINTPDDDLFFVITADGKTGYYSSMRQGGFGKKDIYQVTFTHSSSKKNGSHLTLFKGVLSDDKSRPIGADIEIADIDKNEMIANVKSNSVTGKFLVSLPAGKNYSLTVKKEGYLFYSENFNIPDSSAYKEIDKKISIQKIDVGDKIILKNVFFDYGKATLKPESKSEINQVLSLMKTNPSIKIEIAGYTDNESSSEFNLKLSQARAQTIVSFLLSAGIDKERLIAKGYGEADPIFSNDTEEGRAINRRTEFKILNIAQ